MRLLVCIVLLHQSTIHCMFKSSSSSSLPTPHSALLSILFKSQSYPPSEEDIKRDNSTDNLFHYAAMVDSQNCKTLLEQGVSPNSSRPNTDKKTALHFLAANLKHDNWFEIKPIIELFVEYGGDFRAKDSSGKIPADYCSSSVKERFEQAITEAEQKKLERLTCQKLSPQLGQSLRVAKK